MRFQPIKIVWNKFGRIVRDLAVSCGKKIELKLDGSETTLDKTIIDSIKDPLTHLIRNSVDHGIEMPEDRLKKGKLETGFIQLKAYQENGKINIEISDDGKGIQVDKIKEKAIAIGMLSQSELETMSKEHILSLIFKPGFSTNDQVTNISGRGVGMDVVRTNIESIGGTIEIDSEVNKGSNIKIVIPLTLAIIPTLIVNVNNLCFALPQNNVRELIRVKISQIETIHNVMVYRLRGNILPIISLANTLNVNSKNESEINDDNQIFQVIVIEANDTRFGVIVDSIKSTQEIVVKPLSNKIKKLQLYSGVTILGNGDVALILDLNYLAKKEKIKKEYSGDGETSSTVNDKKPSENSNSSLVLLVENSDNSQVAVPISLVKRLEKINCKKVENVSGKYVVQYHGKILRLLKLSEVIDCESSEIHLSEKDLDVFVVSSKNECDVGIVVEKIIDSSNEDISNPQGTKRLGVHGTTIIKNKITEIIDVDAFNQQVNLLYRE